MREEAYISALMHTSAAVAVGGVLAYTYRRQASLHHFLLLMVPATL